MTQSPLLCYFSVKILHTTHDRVKPLAYCSPQALTWCPTVGTYLRSFSQISPTSVARQEIYVRDPKKIKVDYDLPRTLSNNSAVLLDNVPHILSSATLIITNSSRRQRRIKLVEDLVGIHLKQCNLSVKLSNELAHHQNLSRACLLPDSVVVVVPAPSPNKQCCSVVVCLILCLLLPTYIHTLRTCTYIHTYINTYIYTYMYICWNFVQSHLSHP